MKPSRRLLAVIVASTFGALGAVHAQSMNKDAHDAAYKAAGAQYKSDKAGCASLTRNAKDVCSEEAKGREKVAKAEADAAYEGTPKAREAARLARADATYNVDNEKCDDLAGNAKDVCIKEAKAVYVKAKADAKADRVAADTHNAAAEKIAAARRDAAEDTRDANYKVAVEKCDALAGAAKDNCVRDAKMRYGKS